MAQGQDSAGDKPISASHRGSGSLAEFAYVLFAARSTSSRRDKRRILAEYLRSVSETVLPIAVTYLTGRPFPRAENRTLATGGAALSMALVEGRPGTTEDDLRRAWLRHSDAGDTAADIWDDLQPEGKPFSLLELKDLFITLSTARRPGEKIPILVSAFRRMNAEEIRAAVKVMLSETRMGIQESTVEDAVAAAFDVPLDVIRAANRHRANLGAVAVEALAGEVKLEGFAYFTPVDPMLAHPATDAAEVIRRLGRPVRVEDKYDGVRCQLHKDGAEVRLFSRDRKDISRQFPEVVAAFSAAGGQYALDGELMASDNGTPLPFARLQQRLNRVAPSASVVSDHPVALVAFDILALDDASLLEAPLTERRRHLELLELPPGQFVAPVATAETETDLDGLFEKAQARGNEGLMCKDPDSPYRSGRRGYSWLKLKRPLETLDVVIVGAEWGHGKRRNVLSDYTFAVRDDANQKLVNIGKAYGGLTDAEIAALTEQLKAITIRDFGRYRSVTPQIVLEVEFNNIQESRRHQSGYALRFPRIVRIRPDKSVDQINTLEDVRQMHEQLAKIGTP